jgi:hypothetical protein
MTCDSVQKRFQAQWHVCAGELNYINTETPAAAPAYKLGAPYGAGEDSYWECGFCQKKLFSLMFASK